MDPLESPADILGLIAARRLRRPARPLAFLDELFRRLARCALADAEITEGLIWDVWMSHPHRAAADTLELATRDIAARRYDIAETRLALLLRRAPQFAAMLHFAEILLDRGAPAEARFAFHAALTLHPHLPRARAALADKA